MRRHLPLEDVLVPLETIQAIGTNRIVLSGGEPRLHPQLKEIVSYYRKNCKEVIIITNGYGLDSEEIARLTKYGATGFTISLDSVYAEEVLQTRETIPQIHRQIMSNLIEISKHDREFELGINSVVSHITANWSSVHGLLEFGNRVNVDFIKFQPIFNDGYVEVNAPNLMLDSIDTPALFEIAQRLETRNYWIM